MPLRKIILSTNYIYHIYNRGVEKRTTFENHKDYHRAMACIWFYRYTNLPCRLSYFLSRVESSKKEIFFEFAKNPLQVEIYSYCLMPNHFHLLLRQDSKNGITVFMRNFQDSYAKYFNIKNKRKGILFSGRFQARLIENDDQFLHVSRYIHLNPYASSLVGSFKELTNYPWSSLPEYLGMSNYSICNRTFLKNYISVKNYKTFISDQADYARSLEMIKHQVID